MNNKNILRQVIKVSVQKKPQLQVVTTYIFILYLTQIMPLTTEDPEKDIIIKDLYYINDLAYENTENYKLYPQISQIAQIK